MILALVNSKGGVGKTTIAVHFAAWAAEQGRKPVFVDCDVQASSSGWLAEAAPSVPVTRLLTSDDIVARLPLIAAASDIVIVDGPAGLSEVTRAILCLADLAVFPCGPSVLDVRACLEALKALAKIRDIRGGKPKEVIIPNKLQHQYTLSKELVQTVRNLGMPAGNGLTLRQAYAAAAQQGTVAWRLPGQSAREATAEMQILFQQLISYDSK